MATPLTARFWSSVAAVMAYRGMTEGELAASIGVERTALNSKKNGKRRTTLDDVDAILGVLPEVRLSLGVALSGDSDNRQYQSPATTSEQAESHNESHLVEVVA